jgi:HK97 family phage major capsid protein
MKVTKHVEEARALLDEAIAALDDQDAKIQALPDDVSDEEREFHEALFAARQEDVDRRRAALERLIAIDEAKQRIPPTAEEQADGDVATEAAARYQAVRVARELNRVNVVREPLMYDMGGKHSYFRDLVFAETRNDVEAGARLREHGKQMIVNFEKMADVTTADPGAASFIPPLYMGGQWIDAAIAGRPFADAVPKIPLSPVGKQMDFPRVQVAPVADIQTAENNAVQETDFDAETYSVSKVTIAGQNDVSIQALEFSDPSIDVIIMRELTRTYNAKLDSQLIYGSGASGQMRGIKTVVVSDNGNTAAFASGNGAALLGKVYDGLSQVATNAPGFEANTVLLHPRRAAWMASHRDASGNLFQQGQLFLAAGPQDQGFVGNIAGLRVIRDSNVLTNQGAGSNEDDVYVMDITELMLAEGPLRTRVLQEVLSGTLQVRIQLYAFAAFAGGRRPKVLTRISGAGLVSPTFPST